MGSIEWSGERVRTLRTQRGQEVGLGRVHAREKLPVAGRAKDVKEQG